MNIHIHTANYEPLVHSYPHVTNARMYTQHIHTCVRCWTHTYAQHAHLHVHTTNMCVTRFYFNLIIKQRDGGQPRRLLVHVAMLENSRQKGKFQSLWPWTKVCHDLKGPAPSHLPKIPRCFFNTVIIPTPCWSGLVQSKLSTISYVAEGSSSISRGVQG